MAYSTLADIKAALPKQTIKQLTDDDGLGFIDEARVTAAIADADGEIDGYLEGGRYTVPLSPVPEIINRCSIDIATYHLYKRRMEEMPETRRMAYKDATRILERISDGKMKLTVSTPPSDDYAFGTEVSSHFGDDT